jgi:hypothetical protein
MLKRGSSEAVVMERGQEYELHNKDVFCLLLQEFPFQVEFAGPTATEEPVVKRKAIEMKEEEEVKSKKVKASSHPQAVKITDFFATKATAAKPSSSQEDAVYSIGFPSISTNMFQFDIHQATQVVQKVSTNICSYNNVNRL